MPSPATRHVVSFCSLYYWPFFFSISTKNDVRIPLGKCAFVLVLKMLSNVHFLRIKRSWWLLITARFVIMKISFLVGLVIKFFPFTHWSIDRSWILWRESSDIPILGRWYILPKKIRIKRSWLKVAYWYVVVAEASAPKTYPRVTLASARTLSGSVVKTLRDGEGLPNMLRIFTVEAPKCHPRLLFGLFTLTL